MKLLRASFYVLVAANLLLFALSQGWLGQRSGGEPERLDAQLAPEKIRIVRDEAPPAGRIATPAAAPLACRALTGLTRESAQRLGEQWHAAERDVIPSVHVLDPPTSYWVFLPPATEPGQNDARVAELRSLGVRDLSVIQEGPLRSAISLGVFRAEEQAREQLAMLTRRGVSGAQVGPRTPADARAALELRGPAAKLEALQAPSGAAWATCAERPA